MAVSRTSSTTSTPAGSPNLEKDRKSLLKRIRSLSSLGRKLSSPRTGNSQKGMLGRTASTMSSLEHTEEMITMHDLSSISEGEQATVKRRPSLIKRFRKQFQRDDIFSVESTPPVSRASTVSGRSVGWGGTDSSAVIASSRIVSPDLSAVQEESLDTLNDYFDAAITHSGRLIQGVLYICNGYLLFNARQFDKIVARVQIDLEVLLAAEKRDWLGSPSAIWLAMLGGNVLLVNLRERDKCLEGILQTWSKRLSALHPLTPIVPKVTRSLSLGGAPLRRDTISSVIVEPVFPRGGTYAASLPCRCNAHYANSLMDVELQANPIDLFRLLFGSSAFMSTFLESHEIRILKTTEWIEIERYPTRRMVQTFPKTSEMSVDRLLIIQTLLVDSADLITVDSVIRSGESEEVRGMLRWCMIKPPRTFNRTRLMLSMHIASVDDNHPLGEQFRSLLGEDLRLLLRARFPIMEGKVRERLGVTRILHFVLSMNARLLIKSVLIIALAAWIAWMLCRMEFRDGSAGAGKNQG